MKISVLFFATLKDLIQRDELPLDIASGSTIGELKAHISSLYPETSQILLRAVASINHQFAFDEDVIPDNAEIAIFPPVSGGSSLTTLVQVTYDPFDLDKIIEKLTLVSTGAVCIFTGIVRGETTRDMPHTTVSLEYEAYISMAEEKMAQIAVEIRSRWPKIEGIALIQRIGLLKPGTPTVVVACASSHRENGIFEASRYGIDRLKEIVPVWKKEINPDGETWVEGHYHPQQGD
jgi:molybdopterin synthase catalytic subunit